jgi:hypothetical protein
MATALAALSTSKHYALTKPHPFHVMQILASYFVLIPLRDEISVQLGTKALPVLFVASLLVNTLSQMAASGMLASSGASRKATLSRFYAGVAAILGGFVVALSATSTSAASLDSSAALVHNRTLTSDAILSATSP